MLVPLTADTVTQTEAKSGLKPADCKPVGGVWGIYKVQVKSCKFFDRFFKNFSSATVFLMTP